MKIITGMHRSGSSILSKLFFECGADFGPVQTMYPADKWNPDGYYEQLDILKVNLFLVNGPFGKLSYLKLPSDKTILQRSGHVADQIRKIGKDYEERCVKENRFCLTLNAWLEHGTQVDGVIICLRNPRNVATSLWRRNKLPIWIAYRLWLQHYERLLSTLEKHQIPHTVADYDTIKTNTPASVKHLQYLLQFFNIDTNEDCVSEMLQKNLRTLKTSSQRVELPDAVMRMYLRLKNMANHHEK
ncbi:MAG: hypothetical protein Kow0075_15660 [Salibacteraceae bacterium]